MNSINDSYTRLEIFCDSAQRAKNADLHKITAKRVVKEGGKKVTELYHSKKQGTDIIENFKSRLSKSTNLARKELRAALEEVLKDPDLSEEATARDAVGALRKQAKNSWRALDAEAMLPHLKVLVEWRKNKNNPVENPRDESSISSSIRTEPALFFSSPGHKKTISILHTALQNDNQPQLEILARQLGESFARTLVLSKSEMIAAITDGKDFKNQIAAKLELPFTAENGKRINDFLNKLHQHAADKFALNLPDKVLDKEPTTREIKSLGNQVQTYARTFELTDRDGKNPIVCEFEEYITAGGFGTVDKYQDKNDPARKFIVKTLLPGRDASVAKAEIAAHLAATEGGTQHIIGLEGVLRMHDGSLALVLEYAPNGTLYKLSENMGKELEKGTLLLGEWKEKVTGIIKGGLKGLVELRRRGLSHFDLNSSNLLFDKYDNVKLSDFGTAIKVAANGKRIETSRVVDNAVYRDPAANQPFAPVEEKLSVISADTRKKNFATRKEIEELKQLEKKLSKMTLSNLSQAEKQSLKRNQSALQIAQDDLKLLSNLSKNGDLSKIALTEEERRYEFGSFGADTWSMGINYYELLTRGDVPFMPNPEGPWIITKMQNAYMGLIHDLEELTEKERIDWLVKVLFEGKTFGGYRIPIPANADDIPLELKRVVATMLAPNPEWRSDPEILLQVL